MGTYRTKLLHHYHELNARQRIRYHLIDRFRFDKETRFFFEGCRKNPGQMFLAERRELYRTVLHARPQHCFEVGTYKGGGSTYFLASAFCKLGRGKLLTIERDRTLWQTAKEFYKNKLPHLFPYVEFINDKKMERFLAFIEDRVDCIFLDGAEDGEETLQQYEFFRPFLKTGSILMAHDWDTEKMIKIKQRLLRPESNWKIKVELKAPESVGFVVMELKA